MTSLFAGIPAIIDREQTWRQMLGLVAIGEALVDLVEISLTRDHYGDGIACNVAEVASSV